MLNKKSIRLGFSLLEMVMVFALIGIIMTIIMPSFRKKNDLLTQSFRDNFTLLLHAAYLKDKLTGDLLFAPLKAARFIREIEIPRDLEIRNFYIHTKQGIKDQAAQAVNDVWFFLTSDGIAQELVINIVDTSDKPAQPEAGLILNPFTLNFELYDTFQKLL